MPSIFSLIYCISWLQATTLTVYRHSALGQKVSALREELNMKSIRETEARGTDYVPSFDSPPTAMRKFTLNISFTFFRRIWNNVNYVFMYWYLYFVTRQWMKVAIKTLLRSVPTQKRRPPPKAMKCFVPPVISTLSCSSYTHKICSDFRKTGESKTEHSIFMPMHLSYESRMHAWRLLARYENILFQVAEFYLLDANNVSVVML